jgi:hypothetical protein
MYESSVTLYIFTPSSSVNKSAKAPLTFFLYKILHYLPNFISTLILKSSDKGILQTGLMSFRTKSTVWYSKKHSFHKLDVFILKCMEGGYYLAGSSDLRLALSNGSSRADAPFLTPLDESN